MAEGIIVEVGQGGSNGGRPPMLLDIDRAHNYALGITVEPRAVNAAVVRWDGTIVARRSSGPVSAFSDTSILERAILRIAGEALAAAEAPFSRVRGIGVGISALVDPARNEAVVSSTMPAATGVHSRALAEHFGKPVYLEDIAYLMALGERWFVYPNDERPLIFLTISSGTCGAVLEPWAPPGASRFAAEFGHMVVDASGPLCGCGKRGCLESIVSETALLATANRLLGARREAPLSLDDVATLADDGNAVSQRIIAAAAEHLGVAIANLANIFAPALIILGGSVVDAWTSRLMPQARAHVQAHLMEYLQGRVEILPSRLGPDAPLLGSAARVLEAFFAAPRLSLKQPRSAEVAAQSASSGPAV
jgi:predicted NBD/HSP70 family sugar kinase